MAKKKLIRWCIILMGSLGLLLIIGLVLALNSGIQTSIVRGILQKKDPQAKLESVAFGFSSGEVHGLEMRVAGYPVKVGSATVQYSLLNLLFGHTKTIESATVTGLVFDASLPPVKETAKANEPTSGGTSTPPSVLVKKVDVAGSALLPAQRSVQISLLAQNLGSGSEGKATGTMIFQDKSPDAKVGEMHADTQVSVALDDALLPTNLDLLANLAANMPGQTQTSKIQAHLTLKPVTSTSGQFTVALAPPDAGAAQMLGVNGTYSTEGSAAGDFSANLNRAQIEPFAFGLNLPDFSLAGQGQFSGDAKQSTGSLKAAFTGTAGHLENLRAQLAGVGDVQFAANVDVAVAPGKTGAKSLSISGKTLSVTLAPQGGQTTIAVALLKPVTMEIGDQGMQLPAGTDVARLTLTQVPAAWLTAVMPKDYAATGQGFNGQILISARDDGTIVANTEQPLSFAGLDVQQNNNPLLAGGAIQLDGLALYANQTLTAQIRKFSFQTHTVASGGMTLTTVLQSGLAVQGQFAGNVSVKPQTGGGLPEVVANGNLTLAMDVDNLDRKALGQNLPRLTPAGLLTLNSKFDLALAAPAGSPDAVLTINTFSTTLTKGMGNVVDTYVSANALQKISVPMKKDAAIPAMSGNLATIDITGFPLAVAQMFLPADMKFSGNPLKGKLLLAGAGGTDAGLVVHTVQALTIEKVQFAQGVDNKLSGVTLAISPEGSWHADNLTGSVHLQATSAAGSLADATVNLSQIKDAVTATVTATGQLGALAEQPLGLEFRNFLPKPPPQYAVSANVTLTPKDVTIASAQASVMPAGGQGVAMADVKLNQGLTLAVDPAAKPGATGMAKYVWPRLNGDVASVKLNGLPAGVAALALPGYRLQGRDISGDVVVRGAGDGNYSLTANAPITATGLGVTQVVNATMSTDLVRDLTFTIKPSATFGEKGLAACGIEDLKITSGAAVLAQGSVAATLAPGDLYPQQAKISLQADLAQFLKQPVLAKFDNLSAGKMQIDGTMSPDGAVQLTADVSNWTVAGSTTVLQDMKFQNATGKYERTTGALQLNLPVKGASTEGPTDCLLALTYGPSGKAHSFSVNLSGNNLVIDDLLAIKDGLFPPTGATPAAVVTPGKTGLAPVAVAVKAPVATDADKVPIWGDLQGTAQIKLNSIRFHAFAITNFQAGAQVSPTQAVIPGVSGTFEGAPLALNATLGFNSAQVATPYQLQTAMSFKNFDVGAYFKSRNATALPPVEGNFSISGNASGHGANLDDLIDKVQFDMALNSANGTFHLLDMVSNKPLATTLKAVSGAAGVANVLIGLISKKAPAGNVAMATSILNLLSTLDSVQYSKLVFGAQRGADLNVKLSQFDLQSPMLELTGTGQITYQAGKAIPDQPMTATLQLNAKSGIEQVLQSVHLLTSTTPGASGYMNGPQFKVGGTMQHPDYSPLYNLIAQAAANMGLGL